MTGRVLAIYTAPVARAEMRSIQEALLEVGKGLVGDRYHLAAGTFSSELDGKRDSELTLIEAEEMERFNQAFGLALGFGALRRNVVTRDVRLNDLVARRFRVGDVVLEGIRLCEPCAHLAKLVSNAVLPGLVHRAGLRAGIVAGGTIRPGDSITLEPA